MNMSPKPTANANILLDVSIPVSHASLKLLLQ